MDVHLARNMNIRCLCPLCNEMGSEDDIIEHLINDHTNGDYMDYENLCEHDFDESSTENPPVCRKCGFVKDQGNV